MTQFRIEDYFAVLPEGDMHGRILFDKVREGIAPFRAKTIQTYLEYDISYNRYRLFVEVLFAGDYRLAHREFMTVDDLLDDTNAEVRRVADLMCTAFRNREEYYQIPSNIHLGES